MTTKRIDELTVHPKSTTSPLAVASVLPIRDAALSSDNTRKIALSDVTGYTRNILHYGADPTGVADSTAAIQAAIDSLFTVPIGGGIVHMPIGKYRITQLTMHMGVTLQGCGPGPGFRSTALIQDNGVNDSAIVMDAEIQGSSNTGYAHGVCFRHFRLVKIAGATDTIGNGIYVNAHTGEGFEVESVTTGGFAENGIRIIGSGPCTMHNVLTGGNGTYGLALERNSANSFQANFISLVSGDNNGLGLIFTRNAHVSLYGIKSEKTANGRNENCVTVQGSGNSEVTKINNISFGSTHGSVAANAFVKLIGANSVVWVTQPNLLLASVAPTDLIHDNIGGGHNKHIAWDAHHTSVYYSCRASNGNGSEVFRVNDAGCKMWIGYDPDSAAAFGTGIGVTDGTGDGASTPLDALAKGAQTNAPTSMTVNKWIRMTHNGVNGWTPFFV